MIHLTISLNNIPEVVTYDVIEKLYLEVTALNYVDGDLVGNLQCTKAYQDSVQYLTTHFPNLSINVTVSPYIRFADSEVLRICTAQYGDGIGCTTADAASVSSFPLNIFTDNTAITSLNDLQYFTGVSQIIKEFALGCTNLASVIIPANILFLSKWTLGDSSGLGSFRDCTSLTNVQLNEGLLVIGQGAFRGCTSLTSIDIPSTVTTLGEVQASTYRSSAFLNCNNLTTVTGGENITVIGTSAFSQCTNLQSLPDFNFTNILVISNDCFSRCNNLVLNLPTFTNLTNIGSFAFRDCTKVIGTVSIPGISGRMSLGVFAGSGITKVQDLGTIDEFYSRSGYSEGCFMNCKQLTEVNLPSTLRMVGADTFNGCTVLTKITGVENITKLSSGVFYDVHASHVLNFANLLITGCNTFGFRTTYGGGRQIYMPKISNLVKDSNYQFYNGNYSNNISYSGLFSNIDTDLLYLRDIEKIYPGTFTKCKCTALVINNVIPPQWCNRDDINDADITDSATSKQHCFTSHQISAIYVPDSALTTYTSDTNWSTLTSIIHPISDLTQVATENDLQENLIALIQAYM